MVCGPAAITVERELVTIRPAWPMRWLLGTRRIGAASVASVAFVATGLCLETSKGRRYVLRGSSSNAIMGALSSAGFPMAAHGS